MGLRKGCSRPGRWFLSDATITATGTRIRLLATFGLCDSGLGDPELGWASLAEITEIKGRLGLWVKREPSFQGGKTVPIWTDNLQTITPWIVMKGSKDPEAAWALIEEMLVAENQAADTNRQSTMPTNPDAMKFVNEDVKPWLANAPEHANAGILVNADFWSEHLASFSERWQIWSLS